MEIRAACAERHGSGTAEGLLTLGNEPNTLETEMSIDHRASAQAHVERLLTMLRSADNHTQLQAVVAECESLARAIAAFHIEGIRFRMFNVDRLLNRGGLPVPGDAASTFGEVRRELEAAGFHTRSHQAPPTTT
jgi:hypothetical protein